VKETLEIIEIPDNTFFEVIIEEDRDDLSIDHLEDESTEPRLKEEVDQIEKAPFLHIVMKEPHLLISEMISDKDQKESSANTTDTMPCLQTDLKIGDVLNRDQNQDVQETSILDSSTENGPQPQPSTKPKRSKQPMVVPADSVAMNTRSRKQTYSAALVTVEALTSFHAAFSVDLERPDQEKPQIPKLHKDDLFIKSRY
jgi:hypothetical protein